MTKLLNLNPSENYVHHLKALEDIFAISKGYKPHSADEVNIEIAQLTASKNVQVKKLVYLYLALASHCCDNIFLLAMNSASNDLVDPNAIVRNITLKAIGEFAVTPNTLNFMFKAISTGLEDSSSSVRCISVNGVLQLFFKVRGLHQPDKNILNNFENLVDKVIKTVSSDPDPTVVVRSLECLAICKPQSKFLQQALLSLLNKITMLDSILTINLLHRASISLNFMDINEEEIFRLLNKLEIFRNLTTNYSMNVESCSLMLKVSFALENVQKDLLQETVSNLFGLLMVSSKNVKYYVLCNLLSILKIHPESIKEKYFSHLNFLLLLSEDSPSVLTMKLSILHLCVNKETATCIFNNIQPYFHKYNNPNIVKNSFSLLLPLYSFLPDACIKVIYCSLYSTCVAVVEQTITVLYQIISSNSLVITTNVLSSTITKPFLQAHDFLSSDEARSSFLLIASNIKGCEHSKQLAKIFKKEIQLFESASACLQYSVLHVCTHCFLQFPKLFQHHMKELYLKFFDSRIEGFIKDQGLLYFKLLQTNKTLLNNLVTNDAFKLQSCFSMVEKNNKQKLKFNDLTFASIAFD